MDNKSYKDYIEEVDLQRYWLVLKRRWLSAAIVAAIGTCGAAIFAKSGDPVYRAQGSLFFQRDRSTSLTGIGQGIGDLGTVSRSDPLQNQATVVQSLSVLEKVVDTLELETDDGDPFPADKLRFGLAVIRQGNTDILHVSYQHAEPEHAAKVVNAVMAAYIERNIAINRSEATAAREFVQGQIPAAKTEVRTAAEALRQFQLQHQIVDLESEAGNAVNAISSLSEEIDALEADLAEASTRDNELRQLLGTPLTQAQQVDTLADSPGVQGVIGNLQDVQVALAQQQSQFTENHPTVANLKRQEAALQSLLRQRVAETLVNDELIAPQPQELSPGTLQMSSLNRSLTNQLVDARVARLSLSNRLRVLEETRRDYLAASSEFPTLVQQQREIEQRLQIAESNYENLLERLQESTLAESQVVASAEIIEQAQVPGTPLPTQDSKLLLAGVVASVFVGFTTAFVLDLIDRSIKTVKDGEVLLGYTLLGLIPKFGPVSKDPLSLQTVASGHSPDIVSMETETLATAGFQMLQANLKFVSSTSPRRAITVTSSIAQEGKSVVTANLAATMARAGKQVLLVDADMRSPTQHHLWNVVNHIGLSHVLVGEGDLPRALHTLEDNLTLLTAGVTPPNSAELVNSEPMETLVQSLLEHYDYVLFDTPPLLGAADAAALGKISHGILMVIRPRWVDSASVLAAKSLLKRSGAEVLGIVANGVDIRNEHDDYVSQIKAGAYPYGQEEAPDNKKKEHSLIPFKLGR